MEAGREDAEGLSAPINRRAEAGGQCGTVHGALDADVVRVLEHVLPARFGGGPGDYQLVEDEATDGRPCLRLLIHPALGPLDPGEVTRVFLEAIGPGAGIERLVSLLWQRADSLRIERRPPIALASGKVLHLHTHGPGAHRREDA